VDERSYFAEASLTDLRRPDQCGCHTAADHILAARTVKKG
jgi:hypothetical protein